MQESPLQWATVKAINQDLEQHNSYENSHAPSFAHANPALKKIQKSTQILEAKLINECLMASPEATYKAIWGEPKKQNARELRYEGGLIVTLKGANKGLWHNFSEGVGGSPIQAIMTNNRLSFKEALTEAAKLAGVHDLERVFQATKSTVVCPAELKKQNELEKKNKQLSAKSIWESSVSAKGTLAEKYLKHHRGIDSIEHFDIRFWPAGTLWKNCNEQGQLEEKVNKIPALIIAARNEKKELTGVQRIYLDKHTAGKNKLMDNAKLSKGIMEGSCGLIQKGMRGAPLYLAEGFETGASIALADSKATVLCSFGVANLKNLSAVVKAFNPKEVIIAGDNDGDLSKSHQAVERAIEVFKQNNLNVRAIFPKCLDGKLKTDWNDVHLSKGVVEVQKQLMRKELSTLSSNYMEPIKLSEKIINTVQMKSMKLSESQSISIQDKSIIIDNKPDLNQHIATYNKHHQAMGKNIPLSPEKSLFLKINHEVDIEL